MLIRREDGTMDNAHFFGFFLIMRRLLPAENFAEMKEAVIALTEKYPFVRMDYYGFRDDWKEKALILHRIKVPAPHELLCSATLWAIWSRGVFLRPIFMQCGRFPDTARKSRS